MRVPFLETRVAKMPAGGKFGNEPTAQVTTQLLPAKATEEL